jgi:non-heme chloroperoxidase
MHSRDDQIVPFAAAGPRSARLLPKGTLKVYDDLPHGMPATHADIINADILDFLQREVPQVASVAALEHA